MRTIRFLLTFTVVGCLAVVLASPPSAVRAQEKKGAKKKTEKKNDTKKKDTKKKDTKKKDAKKKPAKKNGDAKKPAGPIVEHLVSNLENPCGVAVSPKTGHVFVTSRYAIYRYDPAAKPAVHIEVAGYPKEIDIYGKGPKYAIGPLGLAFLGQDKLVVGGGERPDGSELVRIFKIDDSPPSDFKEENEAGQTIGPIKPDPKMTAKGEGNFYGVVVIGNAIFITCNGDDTKGWIAKSEVKDGKAGALQLAIATKTATEKALGTGVDAPGPATASPEGELVIGQKGEVNVAGDSLLTIYDPKTGKLKKALKTGLNDIAGLAYHPKTKRLYATDFSWLDATAKTDAEKRGGLYELIVKGDKCESKKVVALDKPTAIAFDKDGNLYLAQFGTAAKDNPTNPDDLKYVSPGGLYMIAADQLK